MEMENFTPFPNLRFFGADAAGREFGVLLAKGTYLVEDGGVLAPAALQEPLAFTDLYYGETNVSSLRMPSDIVPRKPNADVIVIARAYPPGDEAARSWSCGVRVEGRTTMEARLRVTGPRRWRAKFAVSERVLKTLSEAERARVFFGWALTEPEPASAVPILYEHAFGGMQNRREPGADEPLLVAQEHNPIGCGWFDANVPPAPGEEDRPAPQIEREDDPISTPDGNHRPAGLGAIPPAWLPRRPLGGTFDAHWKDNVWPDWPADYSYAYHNSANPSLIHPGHLTGEETVTLTNLQPGGGTRIIRLPGHMVMAELERTDGERLFRPMELDTLLIDVADEDPVRHRIHLSWRITFDHTVARRLALALVTPQDLAEEIAA